MSFVVENVKIMYYYPLQDMAVPHCFGTYYMMQLGGYI